VVTDNKIYKTAAVADEGKNPFYDLIYLLDVYIRIGL